MIVEDGRKPKGKGREDGSQGLKLVFRLLDMESSVKWRIDTV